MTTGNQISYRKQFEQKILRPLGLNAESHAILWIVLIGALATGGVLYVTRGNVKAAIALLVPYILLLITIYRLEYSLYILVFSVLLFDQFAIPGFTPWTYEIEFFRNLKEITYLPYSPAGVVNAIELHLTLLICLWLLVVVVKKNYRLQPIPAWGAFLGFFLWFLFSFANGLRSGGDFLVALWEIRALVYFCVIFLIVPQIIRTRKQLKTLIWIFIIAISFKAFQVLERYVSMGFTTAGLPTLANHEDPVFITTLLILLTAMFVFNARTKQRWVLTILLVPLLLAIYLSLRRAAIAGMLVTFASFVWLLPIKKQKAFLRYAIPIAVFLFLYGFAFWNSSSTLAGPVQLIKSGVTQPSIEESREDYYSNMYRDIENYNLATTFKRKPVVGIGFGKKYDLPLELARISFPLRDYIPHNEIFWYLIKTGSIGFFLFWLFFNGFVYKGVTVLNKLQDPYLRAVCVMVVLAVINQMVVSYYDLQLTYYRNMIYLGTLMGLLPLIERIGSNQKEEENMSDTAQISGEI